MAQLARLKNKVAKAFKAALEAATAAPLGSTRVTVVVAYDWEEVTAGGSKVLLSVAVEILDVRRLTTGGMTGVAQPREGTVSLVAKANRRAGGRERTESVIDAALDWLKPEDGSAPPTQLSGEHIAVMDKHLTGPVTPELPDEYTATASLDILVGIG